MYVLPVNHTTWWRKYSDIESNRMAGSGEAVNRVAHQASDQGRSEGVVSRLEVVSSCSIGVSAGWTLACGVRVTATENILLDWETWGMARS